LIVPECSGSIARFKFSDLCDRPLSAADYLELTGKYGTVIVESIPRMGLSERDQARRFITFVDGEWLVDHQARERETMLTSPACYENKASLYT
jgi:predicted ATPase